MTRAQANQILGRGDDSSGCGSSKKQGPDRVNT